MHLVGLCIAPRKSLVLLGASAGVAKNYADADAAVDDNDADGRWKQWLSYCW